MLSRLNVYSSEYLVLCVLVWQILKEKKKRKNKKEKKATTWDSLKYDFYFN